MNESCPPVEPGSMRARLRDAEKAWAEASANYHEVMSQVEAAYMNGQGHTDEVDAMSRAASARYAEALSEVVSARQAIPTFEEMLADPLLQVDPKSEVLASIKEYENALPATAGMPVRRESAHPQRCSGTLGSRPSWMSPDQYDPCRCTLVVGHDGPHTCEHEGGPPWVETRPWPAFHSA